MKRNYESETNPFKKPNRPANKPTGQNSGSKPNRPTPLNSLVKTRTIPVYQESPCTRVTTPNNITNIDPAINSYITNPSSFLLKAIDIENPSLFDLMPHELAFVDLYKNKKEQYVTYDLGITKSLKTQKSYTDEIKNHDYLLCLEHYDLSYNYSIKNTYLSSSSLKEVPNFDLNNNNKYFKINKIDKRTFLEEYINQPFLFTSLNEALDGFTPTAPNYRNK